jgi:hypothetical protein
VAGQSLHDDRVQHGAIENLPAARCIAPHQHFVPLRCRCVACGNPCCPSAASA